LTLWQLYIDHGGLSGSFDSTEYGEAKPTSDVKMAAVGGALGAALALVLGLLVFFFMRYRKRGSYRKADLAGDSASDRSHGAKYSAIQRYDADSVPVVRPVAINASSSSTQQPVDESSYAGHVVQVPTTHSSALRTRTVSPTRTGKGFIQTRHGAVDNGTPPFDTPVSPGQSYYAGSSLAREEDPPVYSPDM